MRNDIARQVAAGEDRQSREIETLVKVSGELCEIAATAISRTSDMKARLLGLHEAAPAPSAPNAPRAVQAEISELGSNLERLREQLGKLHENILVLERI